MKKYANNLYLLSFIDVADRIDILLLEIRHLQQSIIDSLHAPTLLLPLRYEEETIFGGWVQSEYINRNKKSILQAAEIAQKNIIRYPSPRRAIQHLSREPHENSIKEALLARVGEIWSGDLWARGERRHYHALRSLQILKQQAFRDKLLFYIEAHQARIINPHVAKKVTLKKPALMILRRAIIERINKYIKILRTHQQQFGKSLDFGLQGHPRPSIERRREIGIFNDFLSNRTRDLQLDMHHLVHSLIKNDVKKTGKITPLVLHGWSQSPKVSNSQLYDNVSLDINSDEMIPDNRISVQHISYIDTSFWSPDRPDLQPLVAKEIAHSVIRNILGNMSDHYLSNTVNDFTDLMVTLLNEINTFTKHTPALRSVRENTRTLLRELANDFLAASIKGISYLYALYLAIIGDGLEQQLRIADIIRLDSVHDLERGVSTYEDNFIWYFRLRLTTFWLRKVMHVPISSLDEVVMTGITEVCDEMVQFLDSNIPSTRTAMGYLWQQLGIRLENKINRSFLIVKVRQWRGQRSADTWDEKRERSGKKMYHRSTMRLHVRLQAYLFKEVLQHKQLHRYKPLYGCSSTKLHQEFTTIYGLTVDSLRVPHTRYQIEHPQWLFRHLYDIPFQCAVMRSIDLLNNYDGTCSRYFKWPEFVKQMHEDMSLGRELFGAALEFYTWARESPRNRLVLCINLLAFILPELDKNKHSSVVDVLVLWLEGDQEATENTPDHITSTFAKSTHEEMSKAFSPDSGRRVRHSIRRLRRLGATQINAAFSSVWESKADQERRLEQLAGYKLKELFSLYNKKIASQLDDPNNSLGLLRVLGTYLEIRDSRTSLKNGENTAGERFYHLLLPSFGGSSQSQQKEKKPLSPINPVMISRIVMTNYYTVAKIGTDKSEQGRCSSIKADTNFNGMSLKQALTNPYWTSSSFAVSACQQNNSTSRFSIVLGQYDAVGINPTRLPCRCMIPVFERVKPGDESKERFASHFTRREVALPVAIYSSSNFGDDEGKLVTILSISLQRRAMRLNLLYRLLKSINGLQDIEKNKQNSLPSLEACLQCLVSDHPDSICIKGYLTDGWGDLLLVVKTNNAKDSTNNPEVGNLIDAMFNLQHAFYEDFMVDRTELIFTPECLDYIANNSGYDFNFSLRLLEDRKLETSISKYQSAFKDKKARDHQWVDSEATTISATPGQMDFLIRFGFKKGNVSKDTYTTLLEWLAEYEGIEGVSKWYIDGMAMLDKIETNIEKKVV